MKPLRYYLILFALAICPCAQAASEVETLKQQAENSQTAADWNRLANYLYKNRMDPKLLAEASQKALEKAISTNDSSQWGEALIYASDLLYQQGKFIEYGKANRKALAILQPNKNYLMQESALINISISFAEQERLDSLIVYTRKAMAINRQHQGKPQLWIDECQNLSYAYSILGHPDSTLHYINQTIKAATAIADTARLLNAYNQLAVFHVKKKDYPKAVKCFEKTLAIYDKVSDKHSRLYTYTNLATTYHKWGKVKQAIKFVRRALADAQNTNEKATYGKLLCNLGLYLHSDRQYQASVDTLQRCLPLVAESAYYLSTAYQLLAYNYELLQQPDSSNYYMEKLDKIAEDDRVVRGELFYATKINQLVRLNKYKEAAKYARIFAQLNQHKKLEEINPKIYMAVALAFEKGANDYPMALTYLKKATTMQDSLYKKESEEAMSDFSARYHAAEKDLKIAAMQLQQEKDARYRELFISGAAIIITLLLLILLYQRFKRAKREKEMADKQVRIEQKERLFEAMEKDMHNNLLHSYIDGSETERKRIAKELHDHVANEILGISMLMKIQPDKQEESIRHLNELHSYVRTLSHNLLPPVFHHASLDEILTTHLYEINQKSSCQFQLSMPDKKLFNGLKEEKCLTIYRIIQELTGNILKYAKASLASVSLYTDDNKMACLCVEDNGNGFNPQTKSHGVGLNIVGNRAEELGGILQIFSSPGNGCKIEIRFPL